MLGGMLETKLSTREFTYDAIREAEKKTIEREGQEDSSGTRCVDRK